MKTKQTPARKRRTTNARRMSVTLALDLEAGPTAVEDDAPHARLTGGDVDADWQRAEASGDEAVGGSVATPDQDVVDEIGRAVGIEIADEDELRMSDEILRDRDRFRWHLESDAADEAEGRHHRRRGAV